VARLDPGLLDAMRDATQAAAADGIAIVITSGWRSSDYQARLLRHAVTEYGSEEEAARWVATPATSPHVAGEAVDVGHADAIAWLAEHGSRFGICRIYRNEPWHFELRPTAIDRGCPRMFADPAHDPRLKP
jgi:LAS superfamily LD-carboxypeptidase LdcB